MIILKNLYWTKVDSYFQWQTTISNMIDWLVVYVLIYNLGIYFLYISLFLEDFVTNIFGPHSQ